MTKNLIIFTLLASLLILSCKDNNPGPDNAASYSNEAVITDFVDNTVVPKYESLKNEAGYMKSDADNFISGSTQEKLNILRADWFRTREAWETTECFLFGPVATLELDPSIDDWPLNSVDLDSVMATSNTFTPSYVASLSTSLKGFHAIEYLIFGKNGNRLAADFTAREKEYLGALCADLLTITTKMYTEWNPAQGNYRNELVTAGNGNATYPTKKAALLEITNAITGIVEEVGASKISEPFNTFDSTLEESQFSKNSFTDFKNNIIGARDAYMNKYDSKTKTSISDFVKQYNKSLDQDIIIKFNAIIQNLGSYNTTFGNAIIKQRPNISNTIAALDDLKNNIENGILPLIHLHVTD
ncbi:MAG: hypothetical protein H7321_03500 [Bacteroidia bacterium]|nr:hypothetical protein [Bacteroidia bacterium]